MTAGVAVSGEVDTCRPEEPDYAGLLLIAIPLALMFTAVGAPGFRVGGVTVRAYQAILLVMLPFAVAVRRGPWLHDLRNTRGVLSLLAAFGLVLGSTLFYRGMPTQEMKEIKNIVVPMLLLLVVLTRYFRSESRLRVGLAAIAIGITGSVVVAYFRLGERLMGVRSMDVMDFYEHAGFTYIWLGVGAAICLGICIWWALCVAKTMPTRLLWLGGALAAFLLVVVSGTRAILVVVLGFPLLALAAKAVPRHLATFLLVTLIGVLVIVSLYPDFVVELVGNPGLRVAPRSEGAERLTESSGYATDLKSRFLWWSLMLSDNSVIGFLLGVDYSASLQRVWGLSHPHNAFVWIRILGGVPAAVLFAIGLIAVLGQTLDSLRAPNAGRSITWLALFLHVMTFAVLMTNSWPGGAFLSFPIAVALTVYAANREQGEAEDVEQVLEEATEPKEDSVQAVH